MALIICNECGKKVSDSAKTCIHCGAPLTEKETIANTSIPEKKEEATGTAQAADEMVSFKSLGKKKQEELVHTFWEEDPIAKGYQKKRCILESIPFVCGGFIFLPTLLFFALPLLLKLKTQDEKMIIISLSAIGVCFVLLVLSLIVTSIIKKLTLDQKLKKYTYEKRFHLWAKTRNVDYYPVFAKESEKALFEQINVDTIRL